jgi:3-phenylpropionate/trans-cinnamate dioxygenase ferredoxin subunit
MDEGRDGALTGEPDADGWVAVCTLARVAAERIVRVRVGAVAILVIQNGNEILACERACPHEQADLGLGSVRDGRLQCPRHQASFGLKDGNISPGWTCRALQVFQVRQHVGHVWLDHRAICFDQPGPSRV